MAIDYLIEEAKSLTEEQITMLIHFAKFLKSENNNSAASVTENGDRKKIYRKAGKYRGQGWMSADFDEPLEEFKEYMS